MIDILNQIAQSLGITTYQVFIILVTLLPLASGYAATKARIATREAWRNSDGELGYFLLTCVLLLLTLGIIGTGVVTVNEMTESNWFHLWSVLSIGTAMAGRAMAHTVHKSKKRHLELKEHREKIENPSNLRDFARERISKLIPRLPGEQHLYATWIEYVNHVADQIAREYDSILNSLGSMPNAPATTHGSQKIKALDRFKQTAQELRGLSAQTHQLLSDMGGIIDAAVRFDDYADLQEALQDYQHAADAVFADLAYNFEWPELPERESIKPECAAEDAVSVPSEPARPVERQAKTGDPDEILEDAAQRDPALARILSDGPTTQVSPAQDGAKPRSPARRAAARRGQRQGH